MPWCSRTAVNGIVCFSNTGTQSLAGHFTFHNWMTFLQEIPGAEDLQKGKVDSWVQSMAEDMSKYYEQTESLKSVLRARGLLKWVRHWDIKVLALKEFSTTHFADLYTSLSDCATGVLQWEPTFLGVSGYRHSQLSLFQCMQYRCLSPKQSSSEKEMFSKTKSMLPDKKYCHTREVSCVFFLPAWIQWLGLRTNGRRLPVRPLVFKPRPKPQGAWWKKDSDLASWRHLSHWEGTAARWTETHGRAVTVAWELVESYLSLLWLFRQQSALVCVVAQLFFKLMAFHYMVIRESPCWRKKNSQITSAHCTTQWTCHVCTQNTSAFFIWHGHCS